METESTCQDCATAADAAQEYITGGVEKCMSIGHDKSMFRSIDKKTNTVFWFCGRCEQEIVERRCVCCGKTLSLVSV